MKITPRKYAQALAMMLDASDKAIVGNFLKVLRRRNHLKMLPKILKQFESEWMRMHGIVPVQVNYPKKFDSFIPELESRLQEKVKGKLRIKTVPSDDLIGGFKIRIEDTLIDASVAGQLKALANRLNT